MFIFMFPYFSFDVGLEQPTPERGEGLRNAAAIVCVPARKDVRRAHDVRDAVLDERLGEHQRFGLVPGAIVDAGQEVAVDVNHRCQEAWWAERDSSAADA